MFSILRVGFFLETNVDWKKSVRTDMVKIKSHNELTRFATTAGVNNIGAKVT